MAELLIRERHSSADVCGGLGNSTPGARCRHPVGSGPAGGLIVHDCRELRASWPGSLQWLRSPLMSEVTRRTVIFSIGQTETVKWCG